MKRLTRKILFILPNLVVILSLIFITLWILNIFNPGMNFLGNKISSILLIVFFVLSLINAIATIVLERKIEE
ncbi:MAG: hypothetical protein GX166_01285 [Clostridiaceae bacterium]|jgi:hypothetical protein|nr:hypothetical protein [Clostridiaceae bacterium]